MTGIVIAVSRSARHTLSKPNEGDPAARRARRRGRRASGQTVKHRSRVRRDPSQPNLRQVHLLHAELFDELRDGGLRS